MSASLLDTGTRRAMLPVTWLGAAVAVSGVFQVWNALEQWRWGDAGWEIAAVSQLSASLGLLLLGGVSLAAMALSVGRRGVAGSFGVVLVFIGVGCGVLSLIALLDAPIVWQAAKSIAPEVARGYKLVTVKAVGLSGLYALGTLVLGVKVLRSAISTRR